MPSLVVIDFLYILTFYFTLKIFYTNYKFLYLSKIQFMEIINSNQINRATIQRRIEEGYEFDLGNYISQAWEIFKKEWLNFSLYSLLFLLIIFLSALTVIGTLFVVYPLLLGFFIGADKVKNGEPLSLGDMFGGFKKVGRLAILVLIPILIMGFVMSPFIGSLVLSANSEEFSGMAMGSMFLMYGLMFILGLLINLALFFAPYLIFFGDYGVVEALKTSWKLSIKKPLMIILYGILIGFLAQLGTLVCGIGVFVSLGFAYVCYYPAMKDILFDEKINMAEAF